MNKPKLSERMRSTTLDDTGQTVPAAFYASEVEALERELEDIQNARNADRLMDRDNTFRLNALENLLSRGRVVLSVVKSGEGAGSDVLIECFSAPEARSGHGNLRNALDVLRKR